VDYITRKNLWREGFSCATIHKRNPDYTLVVCRRRMRLLAPTRTGA
jgi:hypothetical protein